MKPKIHYYKNGKYYVSRQRRFMRFTWTEYLANRASAFDIYIGWARSKKSAHLFNSLNAAHHFIAS